MGWVFVKAGPGDAEVGVGGAGCRMVDDLAELGVGSVVSIE